MTSRFLTRPLRSPGQIARDLGIQRAKTKADWMQLGEDLCVPHGVLRFTDEPKLTAQETTPRLADLIGFDHLDQADLPLTILTSGYRELLWHFRADLLATGRGDVTLDIALPCEKVAHVRLHGARRQDGHLPEDNLIIWAFFDVLWTETNDALTFSATADSAD